MEPRFPRVSSGRQSTGAGLSSGWSAVFRDRYTSARLRWPQFSRLKFELLGYQWV